ncbi:MAG: NAD-binding protein, partial [Pseudomonadota bacterium]
IVHCGGDGAGQGAKMCNNMMLAVQMIGVCEGFRLAEDIGLDPEKLFEVSSQSSAQCWSLNTYCPYPGIMPNTPSSRGYRAGFSASLMLKDMALALDACDSHETKVDLARQAYKLYQEHIAKSGGHGDFSGIFQS